MLSSLRRQAGRQASSRDGGKFDTVTYPDDYFRRYIVSYPFENIANIILALFGSLEIYRSCVVR
jgi:hypothetical protein